MSSAYLRRSQRSLSRVDLKRTAESGNNNGSRASYGFLKQVAEIEPSEYNYMMGSQGTKKGVSRHADLSSNKKATIEQPMNGAVQFYERQ